MTAKVAGVAGIIGGLAVSGLGALYLPAFVRGDFHLTELFAPLALVVGIGNVVLGIVRLRRLKLGKLNEA